MPTQQTGSPGNSGGYKKWIQAVANGIGSRPAWVILEPDSISLAGTLSKQNRQKRFWQLRDATVALKASASVRVYLDGGHSAWNGALVQADYLVQAGIKYADGFFTNVANFRTTADEIAYGKAVSARVGGKHFVIDTSRNGIGPYGYEWCNPPGRAIGTRPTMDTGEALVDAFLWVKPPGESDGTCNGGPPPGAFWLRYALDLVRQAFAPW